MMAALRLPKQANTWSKLFAALRKPHLLGRAKWKLLAWNNLRRYRASGLTIGANTTITSAMFTDPEYVIIGDWCSISGAAFLCHSGYDRVLSHMLGRAIRRIKYITVGDFCFIGAGAILKGGQTIGNYCIVEAGAVICQPYVPAGSIMRGNPAVCVGLTDDYITAIARTA